MNKSALMLLLVILFTSFSTERIGYKPGDVAADFKLKNIDDQLVSLADMKTAKGFILIFICNHCPCVAKYEERILALDKKYKALGYPVVAINSLDILRYPQESLARMKARAKFKNYSFPYLSDEEQTVVKEFGAPSTPFVYVLQKVSKQLVVRYTGGIDDCMERESAVKEKYVENAITDLLAGKKVTKDNSKTIGCAIAYRNK